jgi:hypothetical protein
MEWMGIGAAMLSFAMATMAGAAHADGLPLDEVLLRAQKMMGPRDTTMVCAMTLDQEIRDKAGKPEDVERREAEMTAVGDKQDIRTLRMWKNGKELTPAQLAEQQKKEIKNKDKKDEFDINMAPLDKRNFPDQRFSLLRMDTLWGHSVYVIKVDAVKPGRDITTGTLWIDADKFYEMKGELAPVKRPKFTEWMHMQEQYVLDGKGQVAPTVIYISGGIHFLFVRKSFYVTMKWSKCN